MKRNMASFSVTPKLIEEALFMPEGYEIVGGEWDFSSRTIKLFIEGPGLPVVNTGEMLMHIRPSVTKNQEIEGLVRYEWNWNCSELE
ncbi:MAG: hypothetical protein GXP14_07420 [Gammaproteobacteria bacterium]|nr:hypothetical protein [Gammaproteobacteria bacterium]